MLDFLTQPFASDRVVQPFPILLHLVVALLLGLVVAWVYRKTRTMGDAVSSFPATLVLLPVLIAMVTQVIGDNVARAFSLVGALSIVRFRTVVRDTQDTAYVIFAVIVGMAVGANYVWVAVIGIAVVGAAATFIRFRAGQTGASIPPYRLNLRLAPGQDIETLADSVLTSHVRQRELLSIESSRDVEAVDFMYDIRLQASISPGELVKALHGVSGVLQVEIQRRGFEK